MTDLRFDGAEFTVTFEGWEVLMLTGRRSYTVAATEITSVRVEPGWTSEILGVRSGLVISGYRKLATFTHPSGTRRLVSMTRGLPLLRIGLGGRAAGIEFDELLLSTPEAEQFAEQIRQAVPA